MNMKNHRNILNNHIFVVTLYIRMVFDREKVSDKI